MTEIQEDKVLVNVARQPIFDDRKRLWGYELFCVGLDDKTCSGFPDEDITAIRVANSAYMEMQKMAFRGKKIVVCFNEKSILENLPHGLPPSLTAIKVSEKIQEKKEVLPLLNQYQSEGFLIVISDYTGNPDYINLYEMADIIYVDSLHWEETDLKEKLSLILPFNGKLLSASIESLEVLKAKQALGFSLFKGSFFKKVEAITVRKLSAHQIARFNLLSMIEESNPDTEKLAEKIQSDVSISFRLLSYLNSASFGFAQKIQSIQQAIMILGWKKMKNWLRVILLSDVNESQYASELVILSVQRGKFLETISRDHDFWGFNPESMHLLGLFSLLDAMMGIKMEGIVSFLPLEDKIKEALCGDANNEYYSLLKLIEYVEEAKWDEVEQMIQQLNLDDEKVKAAFLTAVDEASELSLASS